MISRYFTLSLNFEMLLISQISDPNISFIPNVFTVLRLNFLGAGFNNSFAYCSAFVHSHIIYKYK